MPEPALPPHPRITFPPGYESTIHALLAAILTPAVHEQRARFMAEHDREPTQEEWSPLENGVFNEWARVFHAVAQRFEEGRRRG